MAAQLWQQALAVPLRKPSGGIRAICLQESPTKLAELALLMLRERRLQEAAGRRQFGAGSPGGAQ
eukprot:18911-Lingulodinium_polyedra.AAC.1